MAKKKFERVLPEGENLEWKLIREEDKSHIDSFIELYKENAHKARVKFFNSKEVLQYRRAVLFEYGKNDFEFTIFRVKYGISVTSRMYHHQKKIMSVIYKGGKFYYICKEKRVGSIICPLTLELLTQFISSAENISSGYYINTNSNRLNVDIFSPARARPVVPSIKKESQIFNYMTDRFNWIKTLSEHQLGRTLNFNRVKSEKLFSFKDINRFYYKVPNNIAQIVLDSGWSNRIQSPPSKHSRIWQDTLKYLDGVQNLTTEFIKSPYFHDTCIMAKTLGRKVNCSWGLKRLKEEHDKWSREITNIILDCEKEYELSIKPIYKAFGAFSGYHLFRTNKELLFEGIKQDHCVGTYIDRVNRGECAIFHVKGYTLQVTTEKKKNVVTQNVTKLINKYTGLDMDIDELYDELDVKVKKNEFFDDDDEEEFLNKGVTITEVKEEKHIPEYVTVFRNSQLKGYKNCDAPKEIIDEIQEKFDAFFNEGYFDTVDESNWQATITHDARDARYDRLVQRAPQRYDADFNLL